MNVSKYKNIFVGKTAIIPMRDVQHIETSFCSNTKKRNGIWIIMKSTNWNYEYDMWDNAIYLDNEEAENFINEYCQYIQNIDGSV